MGTILVQERQIKKEKGVGTKSTDVVGYYAITAVP